MPVSLRALFLRLRSLALSKWSIVAPLIVQPARIENLSLMGTLDRCDIGLGDLGRSEAWGRVHAEFYHRFFYPRRADRVDPNFPRHFERSGAHKTVEAGIDHRDRCTSQHRAHRKYAAG